jgi:hypothetical protein
MLYFVVISGSVMIAYAYMGAHNSLVRVHDNVEDNWIDET